MANEFKIIDTQEAFDAAVKERLERQKKAVTAEVEKRYEGYLSPDDAKKLNEALDAAKQESARLTAERDTLRLDAVKVRIAHEAGLPQALAGRLAGDTEDAIRKDAEALAAAVKPAAPQAP
ncbi:MAG: DUF4355 domain-containing protein, partial [Oscillospiraceae bacterium]|nr:DUF4355 domain-containing protein [Oscillospiraceae bacterium]